MIKTYEELVGIKIETKINTVWDILNDNVGGYCDEAMEHARKFVCLFLSIVSKKHNLNDIKMIFDIGSCNGAESVYLAQLLPNCIVHSFDANPNACINIKDNQKKYTNLHCHNLAISNFEGDVDFYLTEDNIGASSLLKPMLGIGPVGNKFSKITAKCTTINKFCEENNITNIDLIWMDLQGNELNALKGMDKMLPKIKGICSEVGLTPYYEGHTLYKDIYAYLKSFGFERDLTKIPFNHLCHHFEDDAIFIK